MVDRWRLRFLGLFLVTITGCTDPIVSDPPPPVDQNRPPVIFVDGPTKVAKGTTVRFDASNTTDPEDDAIEFFWEESEKNPANNFFEGLTLTDPRIQMVVNVVGTFTYTLLAKDTEGNESSSPVTLTVTEIPGEAPVLTGVKIGTVTYHFATTPAPTAFTTASQVLFVEPIGTDVDTSPDQIVAKFGAPIVGGFYTTPNMIDDADGFRTVTATFWLEDPEEHASEVKTITIRIVPKASQQMLPRALHVNCALGANGTGAMESPYNSIAAAYSAASQVAPLYRPDVYVATGTCTESVPVDFHNVNIYGLFEPANGWARRTDVRTAAGNGASVRFPSPTVLTNPGAESLLYTTTPSANGTLLIDGITFKLNGNYYGIDLTSPATEDEKITIQNSEFIGQTVASDGNKVGGGIQIKQGPSLAAIPVAGANIRRNYFSVGAAGGGSRFQVWATHKGNPADASRKKNFHGNVFYGGIGFSTTYSCGEETQKPFAFCLYKTKDESNISSEIWNNATRNLFWLTAGNASVSSTLLSAGGGHLKAIGNIFKSGATAPQKVVLLQGYSSGSDYIGDFSFNAFPVYASNVTYAIDSNVSPNSFNCLETTGENVRFGKNSGSGCGSPLDPPGAIGYVDNSFTYDAFIPGNPFPWRLSNSAFHDRVSPAALTVEGQWDFDGRYGAANDDGASGDTEYNVGPFEAAAPNP